MAGVIIISEAFITPENIVKQQVYKVLHALESCGDIIWFERLQSGSVRSGDHFVHQCRKGTFDMVAALRANHGGLALAFIELKRSDKKAFLSDSQEAFKAKYSGKHVDVHFWLVQSGAEVSRLIKDNAYNRLNDVEFNP